MSEPINELEARMALNVEIIHWYKYYLHDHCGHFLAIRLAAEASGRDLSYCQRVIERAQAKDATRQPG